MIPLENLALLAAMAGAAVWVCKIAFETMKK